LEKTTPGLKTKTPVSETGFLIFNPDGRPDSKTTLFISSLDGKPVSETGLFIFNPDERPVSKTTHLKINDSSAKPLTARNMQCSHWEYLVFTEHAAHARLQFPIENPKDNPRYNPRENPTETGFNAADSKRDYKRDSKRESKTESYRD
jgi:hypothetical protein